MPSSDRHPDAHSALEQFSHRQQGLAQRIAAELEFAAGLAELEDRASWKKLAARAEQVVAESAESDSPSKLNKAVKEAEDILAPIGKAGKQYTVHCVGHAHIDMNWQWSWPETVATTNDTFTTVLALMEEFPDFRFSQSQASVYEIIREHNPELFDQIRRRIAEGRWEVTAAHWVEGEKNLASGESLARHMLYTRQYMQEHFGLSPDDVATDWEPDTFGHAATVPGIVARGGVRWYYMCRGGQWDKPPVFWWQGPDGHRVLVYLDASWYNDVINPGIVPALLWFAGQTGLKDFMHVYGIGDHGGGPTRRDLRMFEEMNRWPVFPTLRFATTKAYFSLIEPQADTLQTIDRELNFEFTGCYTSQSLVKKTNRLGEMACQRAETVAAMGWRALGREYPARPLRDAWIEVLFGHFHDILPGSGVAATRHFQSAMFQKTAAATGQIKTQTLRSLAGQIDTSFAAQSPGKLLAHMEPVGFGGGVGRGSETATVSSAGHVDHTGRAVVVFNPTDHERNDVVTVALWDAEDEHVAARDYLARTPDGVTRPAQRLGTGMYWGHGYLDLAVPVQVPALGYAVLSIEEAGPHRWRSPYKEWDVRNRPAGQALSHADMRYGRGGVLVGSWSLENQHVLAELDPATGGIAKLIDKTSGRNLLAPDAGRGLLEFIVERPGRMSSWVIHPPISVSRPSPVNLREVAPGPYEAALAADYRMGQSTATVTYSVKADAPGLDVRIEADWREIGGESLGTPALRMTLPLALTDCAGRYDIPFGSIRRDLTDGQEVPALRWVDVTGKDGKAQAGLTVTNDCKYGYSLTGSTLRASLIRSSYQPDPLPEMGKQEMNFRLIPHGKTPEEASLHRWGRDMNQPLQIVTTGAHEGHLPAEALPGACVQPASVVLEGIKKAEDSDALIVRLFETAGKTAQANIQLSPALLGKVDAAVEVDLIERDLPDSTAKPTPDGFAVTLQPRGVTGVKVTFGE